LVIHKELSYMGVWDITVIVK